MIKGIQKPIANDIYDSYSIDAAPGEVPVADFFSYKIKGIRIRITRTFLPEGTGLKEIFNQAFAE